MIQYVRAYIETFPTMESHYCKSSRSPTLYILYLKECREKNMEHALQIQISKYYNIIYGTKSFLDGSWFYAQRYRNCEKICTRVFNDRLLEHSPTGSFKWWSQKKSIYCMKLKNCDMMIFMIWKSCRQPL